MGVPGRKSANDELKIAQRYADLTDDFFKVIKKHLNGKNEANQKWAVEQLSKGFVKMIPQEIEGNPNRPLFVQFDNAFHEKR